jgi:hypothetical protein
MRVSVKKEKVVNPPVGKRYLNAFLLEGGYHIYLYQDFNFLLASTAISYVELIFLYKSSGAYPG